MKNNKFKNYELQKNEFSLLDQTIHDSDLLAFNSKAEFLKAFNSNNEKKYTKESTKLFKRTPNKYYNNWCSILGYTDKALYLADLNNYLKFNSPKYMDFESHILCMVYPVPLSPDLILYDSSFYSNFLKLFNKAITDETMSFAVIFVMPDSYLDSNRDVIVEKLVTMLCEVKIPSIYCVISSSQFNSLDFLSLNESLLNEKW